MQADLYDAMFPDVGMRRLATRLRRMERGEPFFRGGALVSTNASYGRPLLSSQVSSSRSVDPTTSGFGKKGSIPPVSNDSFSIALTTTTATISWNMAKRRADGTAQALTGSVTVTGLTLSTKYYVIPYYQTNGTLNAIGFVPGVIGSPAICWDATTYPNGPPSAAYALSNLANREPLSNGSFNFTTPGSGTSSGTAGGDPGPTGSGGGGSRIVR